MVSRVENRPELYGVEQPVGPHITHLGYRLSLPCVVNINKSLNVSLNVKEGKSSPTVHAPGGLLIPFFLF